MSESTAALNTTAKAVGKEQQAKQSQQLQQQQQQQQQQQKKKAQGSNSKVWFWAPECKYSVILDQVKKCGWKLVADEKNESKSNVYWIDVSTIHERFRTIQPWQMINHFPGMPNIARKNRMGQNLNKMAKIFPKEYAFYPRTWVLPGEMTDFRQQFDNSGVALNNKIFIIKPDTGCQGRGIFLTRTFDTVPQGENVVAQVYIKRPLLIEGFKFDLRLYCLVSSVKPLRMWLFHDGLVRMCTEEYVKPNKQNIHMTCMHLTNYAVNKHNSNFQQPSAKSSDETQEEIGKRSLKWFMNLISSEHGETKANALWKRIGVLMVRTVLAIMPTLSREYDQHFKSFGNIPVDVKELVVEAGSYGGSNANGSSKKKDFTVKPPSDGKLQQENEDEGSDNDDDDQNQDGTNARPHFRGSRCFEILGFDVMIDDKLKPWIIEVNHLPSFGTDSPLDQDIKERLMEQVFNALPTMKDDEFAYNLYHKAEAEKRLTANRPPKDQQQPGPFNRRPGPGPSMGPPPPNAMSANAVKRKPVSTGPRLTPVQAGEKASKEAAAKAAADIVILPTVIEPFDNGQPCNPERMAEIKKTLSELYAIYSPEKLNKIDRLLQKYEFREEEFLKFVYSKYGATPPWTVAAEEAERQRAAAVDAAAQAAYAVAFAAAQARDKDDRDHLLKEQHQQRRDSGDRSSDDDEVDEDPEGQVEESKSSKAPTAIGDNSSGREGRPSAENANQNLPKRSFRSLSPPSAAGKNSRAHASWKMADPAEEAAYRAEVLAMHVPKEDDEWMQLESEVLTQFTRIYPPMPPKGGKDALDEAEKQEEEEDDDDKDDDDNNNSSKIAIGALGGKSSESKATLSVKSSTFEDIMFQVFIHDKRQTLRLTRPLARLRPGTEGDTESLPTLDGKNHSAVGANQGRGPGWRAPNKAQPQDKKDTPKVPTQSQVDAATRLSQGLSTSLLENKISARKRYQPHTVNQVNAFVLDPYGAPYSEGAGIEGLPPGAGDDNGSISAQSSMSQLPPSGFAQPSIAQPIWGTSASAAMYKGNPMNMPLQMQQLQFQQQQLQYTRSMLGVGGPSGIISNDLKQPSAASVLRQQLFKFDNRTGSDHTYGTTPSMAVSTPPDGSHSLQQAIAGKQLHGGGGATSSSSHAVVTGTGGILMGDTSHGHMPIPTVPMVGGNRGGGKGRNPQYDPNGNQELFRNLFPGW